MIRIAISIFLFDAWNPVFSHCSVRSIGLILLMIAPLMLGRGEHAIMSIFVEKNEKMNEVLMGKIYLSIMI